MVNPQAPVNGLTRFNVFNLLSTHRIREVFSKCRSCCLSYLGETLRELRATSVPTGRPSCDLPDPASLPPSGCPPSFLQHAWLPPPHGLPYTMPQCLTPLTSPSLFAWLTFIIPRSQLKYYPPQQPSLIPPEHMSLTCSVEHSLPFCYRELYRQLLSQCVWPYWAPKALRLETRSILSVTT